MGDAVREATSHLSVSRFKGWRSRPLAACKELALIQPILEITIQRFKHFQNQGVTAFQSFFLRRLGSCRSLGLRLSRSDEDFSARTKLEYFAPATVRLARI